MRALLAPAAALLALAGPVALTPQASAESTTLKAVIFEEVKPLYHKTDAGYEGLGVDVLEQIRIQAKRRKVDYRVAKSVNDGIGAVITGKADIAYHLGAPRRSPTIRWHPSAEATPPSMEPPPHWRAKPLVW